MSHTQQAKPLRRLDKEGRHGLRNALFNRTRQTPMGLVAAQLLEAEGEIRRLRRQLETLEAPRGDRVMAKMVRVRLKEMEDKAIELLRKAVRTEAREQSCVQLRLLIAERADRFEAPALVLAKDLRRLALDEWLQLSA